MQKTYRILETDYKLSKIFALEKHQSERGSIVVNTNGEFINIQVQAKDRAFFRALDHSVSQLVQLTQRIDII